MAKNICTDCGKVYEGGSHSFFCPDCRKRRQSEAAKARHLNMLGAKAYAQKEVPGKREMTMSVNPPKENGRNCPYNDYVVCDQKERPCDDCGWNPTVTKARLDRYCKTNRVAVPAPKEEIQPPK